MGPGAGGNKAPGSTRTDPATPTRNAALAPGLSATEPPK
jgi:hypothetical protein